MSKVREMLLFKGKISCSSLFHQYFINAIFIGALAVDLASSLMPDFYAAFYQRQLSNSSSIVSLNSRLGYKKQDTAKHEEVKFTSFELKKILDICDNIQGFSNKTITAQLCNAFKNLFSNAHTEHSIHLNSIRSTLSCISGELKVTNAKILNST